MEVPHGPEVSIYELVPGEDYDAYSPENSYGSKRFRGRFVEYYRNSANYLMIRFYPAIQEYYGEMLPIPATNPLGLYLRVFEHSFQSYRYYRTARFTRQQKKEMHERIVLRERRQYERGLTGSTPNDLWFPRDLVREISLKYLTPSHLARWPLKRRNLHPSMHALC